MGTTCQFIGHARTIRNGRGLWGPRAPRVRNNAGSEGKGRQYVRNEGRARRNVTADRRAHRTDLNFFPDFMFSCFCCGRRRMMRKCASSASSPHLAPYCFRLSPPPSSSLARRSDALGPLLRRAITPPPPPPHPRTFHGPHKSHKPQRFQKHHRSRRPHRAHGLPWSRGPRGSPRPPGGGAWGGCRKLAGLASP